MNSSVKVVGGSSSGAIGCVAHPVRSKYIVDAKNKNIDIRGPPVNICIVINAIYYLQPFCTTLVRAEPLENIGSDIDRAAFVALRTILTQLQSGRTDPINIFPFLDKFCLVVAMNLNEIEGLDVSFIMDSVIKLITVVIPPLREVFLGRISSSLDIPGWMNLMSRCFHAQFVHPTQTLEDVMRSTLLNYEGDVYDDDDDDEDDEEDDCDDDDSERFGVPADRIRAFNAKIMYRAPEILVFAVESTHLPLALRFTDMCSKVPLSTEAKAKAKAPKGIRFPAAFDVSVFLKEYLSPAPISGEEADDFFDDETFAPKWYDLASVVTLEGSDYYRMDAFFRLHAEGDEAAQCWYHGNSGASHEVVSPERSIFGNYFQVSDSRIVHPRLLIYTKRGITSVLQRLKDYVTKAGQMRSLGDATFESAETPEHYDEAKHYYEEAIAYDESLRAVLQERLQALEQIERNQRAHSYETQADISLGRRRFKEACDLYKNAMRSAVVNSTLYLRIREKEDFMMRIISLEIANHLTEKGLDCVKSASFVQAKEHFAQALKLNPNYLHLHSIIAGIERAITEQASAQKVAEATQAMKVGKYKMANQLFLDAIALIPPRRPALQPVLDSLVDLMQGEEALIKQRAGLVALEDKKYQQAIDFITEAIKLLPEEAKMEHAFFLCDRAQVYFEMKDYETAISDCKEALGIKPDLAIAYLRMGASQFELGLYDDATGSYERAIRNDSSLSDQVKVKVRQVNTAKEVLQRKEREAERARVKEEERRQLEERRAREEVARLVRQQRLAQEQAEKAERLQFKEEETRMRSLLQREAQLKREQTKTAEKAQSKREKAARDALRAQERERAKAEKERERERIRQEKESRLEEERKAKLLEEQKRQDFAAEMEKAQARQRELEREKEAEKERARLEMERTIAEREKARREKIAEGKKNKGVGGREKQTRADSNAGASSDRRSFSSASVNEAFPSLQSAAAAMQSSSSPPATALTAPLSQPQGSASFPLSQERPAPQCQGGGLSPPHAGGQQLPNSGNGPGVRQWSSVIGSEGPAAAINRPSLGSSDPGNEFSMYYSSPVAAAQAYTAPAQSFNEAIMRGTRYEMSSSSGSAWADHERALLEATAARMSESSRPSLDGASPSLFSAPSSSSPAPTMLSSASGFDASGLPVAEHDPMSRMLSNLSVGGSSGGILASLRSGADLAEDSRAFYGATRLGDSREVGSVGVGVGVGNGLASMGAGPVRARHDAAGLSFSQPLRLDALSQNDDLGLGVDTFSSLLDVPRLRNAGTGSNHGGVSSICSDFNLESELLSDGSGLLSPIQDFRRNQSDPFTQQRGAVSNIGHSRGSMLVRSTNDGNGFSGAGSGLPSLLDVGGDLGGGLLGPQSLSIEPLHSSPSSASAPLHGVDAARAVDSLSFDSLIGRSELGSSLLGSQMPPMSSSSSSLATGAFDLSLGATLRDSHVGAESVGSLNVGGQSPLLGSMVFPSNGGAPVAAGHHGFHSSTSPLTSFLQQPISPDHSFHLLRSVPLAESSIGLPPQSQELHGSSRISGLYSVEKDQPR